MTNQNQNRNVQGEPNKQSERDRAAKERSQKQGNQPSQNRMQNQDR